MQTPFLQCTQPLEVTTLMNLIVIDTINENYFEVSSVATTMLPSIVDGGLKI